MPSRRILTQGESDEPLWIQLYAAPCFDSWATMILPEDEQPPSAGELRGLAFFGETAEAAEGQALAYLEAGSAN